MKKKFRKKQKFDSCLKIYFNFFYKKFKRCMLKIKFSPLHSKYIFATRMKVFETNIEFKYVIKYRFISLKFQYKFYKVFL